MTDATEQHTDGNAIAGILQEIFVAEFTTLERICQSCGDRNCAHTYAQGEAARFRARITHTGLP